MKMVEYYVNKAGGRVLTDGDLVKENSRTVIVKHVTEKGSKVIKRKKERDYVRIFDI